jgi:hypothetical protein
MINRVENMNITYRATAGEYTLRFSGADDAVLKAPAVTGLYSGRPLNARALFAIFPGEDSHVKRTQLLKDAEDLLSRIEGDLDLLQQNYSFRTERPLSGGMQIGGKACSLETGMGNCTLIQYGEDERGKLHAVERIDMRARQTIDTDNLGQITIVRKKRALTIHVQLREFIDFLKKYPDETITTVLDAGKVSLGEIIAGYKEGDVDKEWIRKHLHVLGARARNQLNRSLKKATEDADKEVYRTLLDLMGENTEK